MKLEYMQNEFVFPDPIKYFGNPDPGASLTFNKVLNFDGTMDVCVLDHTRSHHDLALTHINKDQAEIIVNHLVKTFGLELEIMKKMSDNQTRRICQLEDENFLLKMRIEELQGRIGRLLEERNGTIEH